MLIHGLVLKVENYMVITNCFHFFLEFLEGGFVKD